MDSLFNKSVYVLCNSNVWAFYHNSPFRSVSYLHCFLFVCFYFRPLNKKSKVRCLKLFFIIFFHESKVVDMHFCSSPGWEREERERNRGVGADFCSDITLESPLGNLWFIVVYITTLKILSQDLPYNYLFNHHSLTHSLDMSVWTHVPFLYSSKSRLVWSYL